MDNGADGGNRGAADNAIDFGALNNSGTDDFAKVVEVDGSRASQETKKALGQVAVGYAVDLSKDQIDKDTYKELKDVVASFEKKNEANGEKYVDLHGMADRRNEIMTESLDKNWNRKFGGAAVAASGTEVMDFGQLVNEQGDGQSASDGAPMNQGGEQAA